MTRGRVAGAIAGTLGSGSLTVAGLAIFRIAAAGRPPDGAWLAMIVLVAAATAVSCLALVLDYRLRVMRAQADAGQAQAAAELEKTRLEMYRAVLEKAAGGPDRSPGYRDLITADALHLRVEQDGPAHSRLPGGR